MLSRAKLDMPVPIVEFKEEVRLFNTGWIPHFNYAHFEGEWDVIALRSPGGRMDQIVPDQLRQEDYADTALMRNCSAIASWLLEMHCPLKAVRLLRLKKNSVIKEHTDHELAFENGEARLHVPIFSNPQVEFYINKERVFMKESECWYINANLPHSVCNQGESDRIHLVVDCVVNDWLIRIFERSERYFFEPNLNDQTQKIIHELRLQNTPVSDNLADRLQKELNEKMKRI